MRPGRRRRRACSHGGVGPGHSRPHSRKRPRASRRRAAPATTASVPGDVWPESRSEWIARNFPFLNRRGSGNSTTIEGRNADPAGPSQSSTVSARLRPATATALASTARDDSAVRPADTGDDDDDTPTSLGLLPRRLSAPTSSPDDRSAYRPHSLPEPANEVELGISRARPSAPPSQDKEEPARETATAAAEESASATPDAAAPPAQLSAQDEDRSEPQAEPAVAVAPARSGRTEVLAMAPTYGSVTGLWQIPSTDADTTPAAMPTPDSPTEPDTRMAQVPPAPPLPGRRTPPAPPVPGSESQPAEPAAPATPSPPAAPAVPKEEAPASPTEAATAPQPAAEAAPRRPPQRRLNRPQRLPLNPWSQRRPRPNLRPPDRDWSRRRPRGSMHRSRPWPRSSRTESS